MTASLFTQPEALTPATGTQGQVNIVNLSGGKDSTATMMVALATEPLDSIVGVWADTGHEHPMTERYIETLVEKLPVPVVRVAACFRNALELRRERLPQVWGKAGATEAVIAEAVEALRPTGVPFLDLCLWKGRFPSPKARFCTTQLKVVPVSKFVHELLDRDDIVWIWRWLGMRRDESLGRRHLPEWADTGLEEGIYRPLVKWTADDSVAAVLHSGYPLNPLYSLGQVRVGCMPCIMCAKEQLRQIAMRWPEEIARVKRWERLVTSATRQGASTLMMRGRYGLEADPVEILRQEGIEAQVLWSKTSRGGRQLDWAKMVEIEGCESAYGLCE